jgi:hypothetical protein
LLPKAPTVVTAAILSQKLFLKGAKPSHGFVMAVGRCLRELQRDGFARSVPHGRGLGWLLPECRGKAVSEQSPESSDVADRISRPESVAEEVARPGIQDKLLNLLSTSYVIYTAVELARMIEHECGLSAGEAQTAVEAQLLAMRQKRLVRPMDRDGNAGWCRAR